MQSVAENTDSERGCKVVDFTKGTSRDREAHEAGKWVRYFTKDDIHPFDEIEWKIADARIVGSDGKIVFEQCDVEVPEWWNNTTIGIVADKFFRIIDGIKERSAKQIIRRVANTLRSWAEQQNYFNTDQDAKIYEEELCYILLHQIGAFNSPVWFNLGVPGRKQQASACFISSVEDTLDGIMDFQKSEVKIFAGGSGSGVNLSKIRSSYEKLSSGSYTSGPLSWMEGFDKYAKAMKSGGSTRAAAKIVVLDMDHPDILETRDKRPGFISCKAQSEKIAHDIASLGYSVAYDNPNSVYKLVPFQNANHSVSVSDSFMVAVENDGDWYTTERTTGRRVTKYKARELWKEIAKAAWVCGDPGIQFTDTINSWHTTPKAGRINSTNPCFHPDTRIATEFGLVRIEDLCAEFESDDRLTHFNTLVQTVDGPKLKSATVFQTGVKNVIEVHTRRGRVLKVTPDHKLMTTDGYVEAQDLNEDSVLCLQAGAGAFPDKFPGEHFSDEVKTMLESDEDRLMWYKIAGWIVNNGWVLGKRNEIGFLFGKDDKDVMKEVLNFLDDRDIRYNTCCGRGFVGESPDCISIKNRRIWEMMSVLACIPGSRAHNKNVMDVIFKSTKRDQIAFIGGLLSANDTFNIQPKKNIDARIGFTSLELLRGVQALLLNLGVNSIIYKDRHPNGDDVGKFAYVTKSGEVRVYFSKEKTNDLIVTGSNLRTLKNHTLDVNLLSSRKQMGFNDVEDAVNNYGHDKWTDEVVKVIDDGEITPVYDIREPETSSLIAEGVVVHNCSEFAQVDNSACNLCAINLAKLFNSDKLDIEKFERVVRVLVVAQNAMINIAEYPTNKITENSKKLRSIGLNYGNLGTLIMKLGYGYDSDEGRAIAARLASLMTVYAYKASAKLAARIGAFPAFEENKLDMLSVLKRHNAANSAICSTWNLEHDPLGDDVVSESIIAWNETIELGKKYGYSISQSTLQAPLGTLSFLMDMDSTGVEPMFSLVSYKSLVGGGSLKLTCASLNEALRNLGYSTNQIHSICNYVKDNDCIEGAKDLKDEHLSIFDCAMASGNSSRCLLPMAHVKMLAAIQPLITCSISKTVNLPIDATEDDIAEIYMQAWKLGVKCIALYRDGCKLSQPLVTKKDEVKEDNIEQGDVVVEYKAERRHMPDDVSGSRHRFSVNGYRGYIMMSEYDDGTLGEVFLKLGKTGSTIAGLIDGFTQLLSLALQYGIPLDKMIRSFVHTKFDPSGFTSNKQIGFSDSIYDYLFKVLDIKYYGGKNSGLEQKLASLSILPPKEDDLELSGTVEPAKNYTIKLTNSSSAPMCPNCGTMMKRSGTCYACPTCGGSSGCS